MKGVNSCQKTIYNYNCSDKTKEEIKLKRQSLLEQECKDIKEFEELWSLKEKQCEPGLHLGDFIIKKISGPISMEVIRTSSKVENIHLPLIILWGDNHSGNMCSSCDIKEDCYTIYDDSLLKNINKIASKYPLSFYTESTYDYFSSYFSGSSDSVLFKYFIEDKIYNCLNRKHDFSTKCPYKNIEWHSTDIRYMKNIESTISYITVKNPINVALERTEKLIKLVIKNDKINISSFLQHIKPDLSYMSDTQKKGFMKSMTMIAYTLKSASGLNNAIDIYINACKENPSSIMKQLNKIKNKDYSNLEFWKDIVKHCIINIGGYIKLQTKITILKSNLGDSFNTLYNLFIYLCTGQVLHKFTIDEIKNLNEKTVFIQQFFEYSKHMILILTNHFVDLYTILRIIKQPEGGIQPLIALSYQGENHIRGISFMLKKVFDYKDIFCQREDENRCIIITKTIDIEKEIYKT